VNSSDFIKKYKVAKIYAYEQHQVDKDTVMFGWKLAGQINSNESIILSSSSKSKKVSESDKEWSAVEGNSAASLSDYELYFKALTGLHASDFLSKWGDNVESLEQSRRQDNPSYREGEGAFLVDLAYLIRDRKKFIRFGRIYKVIDAKA